MATNWNEILSNTNNLNDVLSILKKVLAGLETKADFTTINEALQDIEGLKVDIGSEVENVNTTLDQFQAKADESIQDLLKHGSRAYPTLAAANADIANIALDTKVTVLSATDGGDYYKATAGATTLTKSPYDPLTQANSYTDNKVSEVVGHNLKPNRLFVLKDSNGFEVMTLNSDGGLSLPRVKGDVQDELAFPRTFAKTNSGENLLELNDSNGVNIISVASDGNIYLPHIAGSLQDRLLNSSPSTSAANVAAVSSPSTVGKAVYAKLPDNYSASTYKWFKDGEIIVGENKPLYIVKSGDAGSVITVESDAKPLPEPVRYVSETNIGGIEIGAAGEVGTLYEGYVLSTGDDFNELDIIAPHKPLGRWFTTRTYLAGARGSDSLLMSLYDTDPYHLGYNDSNRGVPVGYSNMSQDNSVLTLNARVASPEEKKHFQGANRNEVASMISSVGAFSMYAGAAGDGENILEFRVRHSTRDTNPFGWHPTLWTQSSLPSVTYNSNEWDISEGTYGWSNTNYNEWGANGAKTGGSTHGIIRIMDGKWHTVTAIFSHGKYQLYIDGVFNQEVVKDTNSMNEPAYALVSNHIVYGNYGGVTYDKEQWDSMWQGATQEVDYIRLWRKAGKSHIKPLAVVSPVNIAYGATGTITLPSKMELWGRDDVLEHVQTVMTEENEPAGHHTQAYDSLPSFITYDSMTRTATINTAGQKSGRLNFVIYGYLQDGSTCEPARTYANVAPRITATSITIKASGQYDLYAACDCGVLVTDGINRTKAITVSGLPDNVVYNDKTGLIYSNDAALGSTSITIECINSVGQSTRKTINLIVS